MRIVFYACLIFSMFAGPAFATVVVTSPSNGGTVGSPAHFAATATTTSCSKGVASMGVYVNNSLQYVVNGTSLNTSLSLNPGAYNTVVEEWDYCGGASFTPVAITVSNQAGVSVASPANNATVSSQANYVATATTSCSKGVAAMGVYVNNVLTYVANGSSLNTQISLASGTQHTVVEEWDYCGGASYTPVTVTVQGSGSGSMLSNLQSTGGWNSWGELAPNYDICSPCSGVNWSMSQGVKSPSLSGNATQFNIGGSTPYSDVLWSNPVIGQNTTQNMPDSNHTLLPTLHNFTYDAYFYVTNVSVTQVLEFDINMYMNGVGMTWGHQCNILAGHVWDIWNNVSGQWISTGAPCNPINNGWNHVTIQVQRQADNSVTYQSITLNGVTSNINWTVAPFSVPASWWGITVNYQMDGNYNQAANTTFLDNFNLSYW